MTDTEFFDKAEAAFAAIEYCCDRINDESDVDIDNQRTGGMIALTFSNGSQIVINLQKPLHEIWMATRTGGYHYRWSGSAWADTKGREDLFAALSLNASSQADRVIEFLA